MDMHDWQVAWTWSNWHAAWTQHSLAAWTRSMEIPIFSTDMDMHHRQKGWTLTFSMDMDIQSGPGHSAWTRTFSQDLDIQPGHGHAAWTCTCITDIDMQREHQTCKIDREGAEWTWTVQNGHGHVTRTWGICSMAMNMPHGYKRSARTQTCSTDVNMQNRQT
jgi:hypothetical protein